MVLTIMINVVKTMSETIHDWEWFILTTHKNGDDDGLWHCFIVSEG